MTWKVWPPFHCTVWMIQEIFWRSWSSTSVCDVIVAFLLSWNDTICLLFHDINHHCILQTSEKLCFWLIHLKYRWIFLGDEILLAVSIVVVVSRRDNAEQCWMAAAVVVADLTVIVYIYQESRGGPTVNIQPMVDSMANPVVGILVCLFAFLVRRHEHDVWSIFFEPLNVFCR